MNKIVELLREQTKELNDLHLIKGKLLGLYEAQGQIKKAVKFYESVLEQRLKDAKQK